MKDNIMIHLSAVRFTPRTQIINFAAITALALTTAAPLQAEVAVVKGNIDRSDLLQERVAYADLNLREQSNQLVLASRVRKASGKICDTIYRGQHPLAKFESRCLQNTYRSAKPQVDLAIANAHSGTQLAMNIVIVRSK